MDEVVRWGSARGGGGGGGAVGGRVGCRAGKFAEQSGERVTVRSNVNKSPLREARAPTAAGRSAEWPCVEAMVRRRGSSRGRR